MNKQKKKRYSELGYGNENEILIHYKFRNYKQIRWKSFQFENNIKHDVQIYKPM